MILLNYRYFVCTGLMLFFMLNLVYSQSGLNKSKDELLIFIKRPAYTSMYSEVSVDQTSVVTYSKDMKKAVFYNLNSYNRCTGEIMSEKIEGDNQNQILNYLKGYLRALNYELKSRSDNEYLNERERIKAVIASDNGWLNIVFNKY